MRRTGPRDASTDQRTRDASKPEPRINHAFRFVHHYLAKHSLFVKVFAGPSARGTPRSNIPLL